MSTSSSRCSHGVAPPLAASAASLARMDAMSASCCGVAELPAYTRFSCFFNAVADDPGPVEEGAATAAAAAAAGGDRRCSSSQAATSSSPPSVLGSSRRSMKSSSFAV